jgi:hypothetical protein
LAFRADTLVGGNIDHSYTMTLDVVRAPQAQTLQGNISFFDTPRSTSDMVHCPFLRVKLGRQIYLLHFALVTSSEHIRPGTSILSRGRIKLILGLIETRNFGNPDRIFYTLTWRKSKIWCSS